MELTEIICFAFRAFKPRGLPYIQKYIMMTMMSQDDGVKSPQLKLRYDDDDERYFEMPQVRPRVDAQETGPSGPVPELQAESVGHTIPMGTIYIIKTTDGRLAKIGYSTNLARRLIQLKTQASVMLLTDLEIVKTFPGTREMETLLHRRFGR